MEEINDENLNGSALEDLAGASKSYSETERCMATKIETDLRDFINFENYVRKAIKLIIEYDRASPGFLQRNLNISRIKAECIVEILKERGFLDLDD